MYLMPVDFTFLKLLFNMTGPFRIAISITGSNDMFYQYQDALHTVSFSKHGDKWTYSKSWTFLELTGIKFDDPNTDDWKTNEDLIKYFLPFFRTGKIQSINGKPLDIGNIARIKYYNERIDNFPKPYDWLAHLQILNEMVEMIEKDRDMGDKSNRYLKELKILLDKINLLRNVLHAQLEVEEFYKQIIMPRMNLQFEKYVKEKLPKDCNSILE